VVAQYPVASIRVLGVDPGTLRTGWGVIERKGHTSTLCAAGVITAKGFRSLPERLRMIYAGLVEVIAHWQPQVLSLEKAFLAYNVQSALRLGEARGIALLAASQAGLRIAEYNPTEIKTAVASYGRADKVQVQKAVFTHLGLSHDVQTTSLVASKDATDALAAALCHLNSSRFVEQIRAATAKDGRRTGQDSERMQLLRSAFQKRSLPRSVPTVLKVKG
jgi:crossover junction endodeoxyribonuclease RuvC